MHVNEGILEEKVGIEAINSEDLGVDLYPMGRKQAVVQALWRVEKVKERG